MWTSLWTRSLPGPNRRSYCVDKVGRGEWIRTTDLLVPNLESIKNQQLSSGRSGCDPLLHVPTAEQVSSEIEPERSNPSQRLYAEAGHSIGHSPVNATLGSAQTMCALSTNVREQLSVPG